jgi:hypothetical protein
MSQSSILRVDNRAHAGWSPTSWLLSTALAILLGTAGVVLRPALDYRAALGEEELAETELGSLARLRGELEGLRSKASRADLERLATLLHGFVPEKPAKVRLYGDLRSAADLAGVTLTTVAFKKDPVALGPGGRGEWVHLIVADLAGTARPDAIDRLTQFLRVSGQPTLIAGFSLQRSDYTVPEYQFTLQLGFPFYGPAPEVGSDDLTMSAPR